MSAWCETCKAVTQNRYLHDAVRHPDQGAAMTYTRVHTYISFANPFLICDECGQPVARFHDPDRCGCESKPLCNDPCEHLGFTSTCPSWGPVDGCRCPEHLGAPRCVAAERAEGDR